MVLSANRVRAAGSVDGFFEGGFVPVGGMLGLVGGRAASLGGADPPGTVLVRPWRPMHAGVGLLAGACRRGRIWWEQPVGGEGLSGRGASWLPEGVMPLIAGPDHYVEPPRRGGWTRCGAGRSSRAAGPTSSSPRRPRRARRSCRSG